MRLSMTGFWVFSVGVVLSAALGCNRDERSTVADAPPSGGSRGAAPPSPAAQPASSRAPAAAASGATGIGAKATDDGYTVMMKPAGTYTAGQPGAVDVVIETEAPYKVNDEYPFKFQTAPSDGIEFPQDVVRKEAMKLEKTRGTMSVKFKPVAQGKLTVSGKFYFSICTEDRCRFGKQDLALQIEVR